MKGKFFSFLASFLVGFLTLPLGTIIWPPHPEINMPNQTEFMFFAGIAVIEAFAFGAGYYFLVDSFRLIKEKRDRWVIAAYLAIAWSLMSWWPHDRLHMHVGEEIPKLLMIEYGFHATSILSAIIIAKFFYSQLMAEKNKDSEKRV